MRKHYTKEELVQIKAGHLCVVTRRTNAEEWIEIKSALKSARNRERHGDIEHLIDRGMFVRRNDSEITIDTDDGEKTYPLQNILLSVPPDILERDDYGTRKEED